jgi:predicted HicB family RNase H-like nuclease
MAIAKRPLKPTSDTQAETGTRRHLAERAAESFIEGRERQSSQDRPRKVLITHRIDKELLARIDAAARRRGISRAAWINFYLSKCAEEETS